ncbi:hypothetical protein [Parabacteroides sp. PF5-6]|uniref:hypothetical protein n=1 Tax=Parabacteroides sp. PF5-6 TaxID=1742403 RepID=UPI0024075FE8|nr:hypothetical protein [Parabacteroides sp. PF5-6]MDF9831580.1 hypothetical protein [Parabacteroides sp. PF5-6]
MDLDVLKKEWQKNEAFQKEVKESMIKEMISNKNKGAFERIKKYEKEALRIVPICSVAFVFLSASIMVHGSMLARIWVLAMLPIGALLWYWSYWLCGFLNKIDMSRMKVTEVSRYILKYKTYLVRHTVGAAILMPIYLGGWLYFYISVMDPRMAETYTKEFYIIYLLVALVLLFVILWFRFFRHVRDIQQNLKELEQFEQEG